MCLSDGCLSHDSSCVAETLKSVVFRCCNYFEGRGDELGLLKDLEKKMSGFWGFWVCVWFTGRSFLSFTVSLAVLCVLFVDLPYDFGKRDHSRRYYYQDLVLCSWLVTVLFLYGYSCIRRIVAPGRLSFGTFHDGSGFAELS